MADKKLKQKLPGYHVTDIPKGTLGLSNKILEEVLELIDAEKQGCKVMAFIELSDLIGAIEAYLNAQPKGLSLEDLRVMSRITKRAFINGHRT